MSAGKYDALLYADHGLYAPALEQKHQMYDRICVMNKKNFTRLTYNTNDRTDTKWNQYGGTGIRLWRHVPFNKINRFHAGHLSELLTTATISYQ